MDDWIFLSNEYEVLINRLAEYDQKLRDLSVEVTEYNDQSTENFGHDDAVQEAAIAKGRAWQSQRDELALALKDPSVVYSTKTPSKVSPGTVVKYSQNGSIRTVRVVGDGFSFGVYKLNDSAVTYVSHRAPLVAKLIESQAKPNGLKIISIEPINTN